MRERAKAAQRKGLDGARRLGAAGLRRLRRGNVTGPSGWSHCHNPKMLQFPSPVPEVVPPALATRPRHPRRDLPIPVFADRAFAAPPGEGYDLNRSDRELYERFADQRRCPVCGEMVPASEDMWFMLDEVAFSERRYSEGFGHEDCLLAALRLCPWISAAAYARASETRLGHARVGLENELKPVVWVLCSSRYYRVERRPIMQLRPRAPRNPRYFGYVNGDLHEVSLDQANELLIAAGLNPIPE